VTGRHSQENIPEHYTAFIDCAQQNIFRWSACAGDYRKTTTN